MNLANPLFSTNQMQVKFIDYGFIKDIASSSIRCVPKDNFEFLDLPPKCFQCKLANIKPSTMTTDENWDGDAKILFKNMTDECELAIEVQIR